MTRKIRTNGDVGYHSKMCNSRRLCVNFMEPCFIFLQYPPNYLEHFIYKFSFIDQFQTLSFKQYETFNN